MRRRVLFLALLLAACRPITYDGTDQTYSVWQLRYRLMDKLGTLFYCDPDYYPVARGDEQQLAIDRFVQIQADTAKYNAIIQHLGWQSRTQFSDSDKLTIYRESKKLNAIVLDALDGHYAFRISVNETQGKVTVVSGDVDLHGRIVVDKEEGSFATCPICLPADVMIAAPGGAISISAVQPGTIVWSVDEDGRRIAERVLKTRHVPVAAGHLLVRVQLSDGRTVIGSPGHPTVDGRLLGTLTVGDQVDGALVTAIAQFASRTPATYDLLPAGPTGAYWAQGVLIGSTLH